MHCPSCSKEIPDGSRFCADCGNRTDARPRRDVDATRTSLGTSASVTSAPSDDDARFVPGQIVDGRYRIVGLLGRGGMGEVFRADDLKLGQPVALKFLPASLADDADRLQRFLREVKIARQVSHPAVCRVYDVGETDGHHYLSMEYVDGEDLATLLRRIGRLPEDKAVQIARQVCAGLAAAHELGILHRDIKPANIMLDGRGRARLTDFGLAGLAEEFSGAELRAGTPSYMSPEQIEGREVSTRSDIYSLGLVLYELFTGSRAFDGGTVEEVSRRQLQTAPTSPSSLMNTLDPTVERVILACLEKDPEYRPATALAVAAALPGGDPLAAALAAGETPSPEMVAAAGPEGGLRPGPASLALASVVLGWILGTALIAPIWPFTFVPMRKSHAALKDDAREIAGRLGYDDAPKYSWAGFGITMEEYFTLLREHGPIDVADHIAQPGQHLYWMDYRQDDGPIVPRTLNGLVNWNQPSPNSGEVAMEVDLQGRLNALRVTPSPRDPPADEEAETVDWAAVFELAGLDLAAFEPVEPSVRPFGYAESRFAWTGTIPDYRDRDVRVEAASLDGKPVFFTKLISSDRHWRDAGDERPAQPGFALLIASVVILVVLGLLVLSGALFLAVRNLRLGRGDRRGAFRLAAFVFAMRTLHWALAGDHVAHPSELVPLVLTICGATTLAGLTWIVYVAFEPYVRKLWPETMVSWTRLLAGRVRDPLVGRDVLVGLATASLLGLLQTGLFRLANAFEIVGVLPMQQYLVLMRGGRFAAGQLFSSLLYTVALALGMTMLFLILRMVCRRTSIAAVVFCLVGLAFGGLQLGGLFGPLGGVIGAVVQGMTAACLVWVMVRWGLLALAGFLVVSSIGNITPLIFDPSSPFFSLGVFYSAVVFALGAWAWHTSLAGRSLLDGRLLDA